MSQLTEVYPMFIRCVSGARSVLAVVATAGLLILPGGPSAGSSILTSGPDWHSMGRTWAPSGTLRPSCHKYLYHYSVHPPANHWILETFLQGPSGKRLGSDVVVSGADPKRGTKRFGICRSNTRPGRFTIRAKLTYDDNTTGTSPAGWLRPSHFRLRR